LFFYFKIHYLLILLIRAYYLLTVNLYLSF